MPLLQLGKVLVQSREFHLLPPQIVHHHPLIVRKFQRWIEFSSFLDSAPSRLSLATTRVFAILYVSWWVVIFGQSDAGHIAVP